MRERAEERRQAKLALVRGQLESGSRVIRQSPMRSAAGFHRGSRTEATRQAVSTDEMESACADSADAPYDCVETNGRGPRRSRRNTGSLRTRSRLGIGWLEQPAQRV